MGSTDHETESYMPGNNVLLYRVTTTESENASKVEAEQQKTPAGPSKSSVCLLREQEPRLRGEERKRKEERQGNVRGREER